MWLNLYNYVDISLKYIFLFKSEHDSVNEDFLISENPTDLQMPGLWKTHELMELIQSLPREIRERDYFNQGWSINQISSDRMYYHSHIAGIRRLIYQTHHDLIRINTEIQFTVIKVPITYLLYYKIIRLSLGYEINFDTDENLAILEYYTLFSQHIIVWLLKVLSEYLLNNKELLQKIQACRDHPGADQSTFSIRNFLTSIFGTEKAVVQFKKLVDSHIEFYIANENSLAIKLYGRSLLRANYFLNINQNGLVLVFLFDKLEISYEWLMNNKNTLDTIFNNNMIYSSYAVLINSSKNICTGINRIVILKKFLNMITTSKYLKEKNVELLTLKFKNVYINNDFSFLECVTILQITSGSSFSFGVLKTIPKYIKIKVIIDENCSIESFDDISENVVKISCRGIEFGSDMKIPNHIESILIKKCVLVSDKTLTLGKNCKSCKINNITGNITFYPIMKHNVASNITCRSSNFEFEMNLVERKKILILNSATICTTMNIDDEMDTVVFEDVTITPGSTVVFNNRCKRLKIENSVGLFDLNPYIGIEQCFNNNMMIEILTVEKYYSNSLAIQLNAFHFTRSVKLPNIYESVELKYISMSENEEITINKTCKKLAIYNCKAIINIQEVEYLEDLYIQFSVDVENDVRFIGSVKINHIRIFDIYWGITSITTILTGFINIQHIEIDDSSIFEWEKLPNKFYDNIKKHITSNKGSEDNSDLLSKLLVIKEEKSNMLIYEMFYVIVNIILRSVLNIEAMNTVSKLELERIAIDSGNCKSLRKLRNLRNLKILRIRSKQITSELLHHLPQGLELLDITDLYIERTSWITKYVIKPSIIVQPYKSLKVLRTEVDFIHSVRFISRLMPFLEILEVQYRQSIKINSQMLEMKIKVRELFVRCGGYNDLHRRENKLEPEEMICFLEKFEFYIDFESLECIVFIYSNRSVFINPKTLQIIN